MEMMKQGKFGNCIPVYDWYDLIYCSKELPIENSKDGTKLEGCIFLFNIHFDFRKKINLIKIWFGLIIIFSLLFH